MESSIKTKVDYEKIQNDSTFDYIKNLANTDSTEDLIIRYDDDTNEYYITNDDYLGEYGIYLPDYKDNSQGYTDFKDDLNKIDREISDIKAVEYGSRITAKEILYCIAPAIVEKISDEYGIDVDKSLNGAYLGREKTFDEYYNNLKEVDVDNMISKEYLYNTINTAINDDFRYGLLLTDNDELLFSPFDEVDSINYKLIDDIGKINNCSVDDLFENKDKITNQVDFSYAQKLYKEHYNQYEVNPLDNLIECGQNMIYNEKQNQINKDTNKDYIVR